MQTTCLFFFRGVVIFPRIEELSSKLKQKLITKEWKGEIAFGWRKYPNYDEQDETENGVILYNILLNEKVAEINLKSNFIGTIRQLSLHEQAMVARINGDIKVMLWNTKENTRRIYDKCFKKETRLFPLNAYLFAVITPFSGRLYIFNKHSGEIVRKFVHVGKPNAIAVCNSVLGILVSVCGKTTLYDRDWNKIDDIENETYDTIELNIDTWCFMEKGGTTPTMYNRVTKERYRTLQNKGQMHHCLTRINDRSFATISYQYVCIFNDSGEIVNKFKTTNYGFYMYYIENYGLVLNTNKTIGLYNICDGGTVNEYYSPDAKIIV